MFADSFCADVKRNIRYLLMDITSCQYLNDPVVQVEFVLRYF